MNNWKSGIYQLRNRVTGDLYVGGTKNLVSRGYRHVHDILRGTHHCSNINKLAKQHGPRSFILEVLERCHPASLRNKEWDWMVKLRPSLNVNAPCYEAVDRGFAAFHRGRLRAPAVAARFARPAGTPNRTPKARKQRRADTRSVAERRGK